MKQAFVVLISIYAKPSPALCKGGNVGREMIIVIWQNSVVWPID